MEKLLFLFCLCIFTSSAESDGLSEEESFLSMNAENPNVHVTDSGLQYEILSTGDGPKPTAENSVIVHYEGKLLDGTVFDSSFGKEPGTFTPKQVIPGWREGLQLMPKGSKWRFFISSKLGYGSQSVGQIPEDSMLIFEVELLDITEPEPPSMFQKIFLQPVFGPIKLVHVIMFVLYMGVKWWMKSPGAGVSSQPKCKASHILVDSEEKMKSIQKRLNALPNVTTEDFGKEAKEHSSCPSKSSGGSLGWFKTGDMVPSFNKICFDRKSQVNTVLGPVKTKFGWHLIYIEDRKLNEIPKKETKKTQ